MIIDIIDKYHFKLFEEDLKSIFQNISDELEDLRKVTMQLQDRIKIMEDKYDKEKGVSGETRINLESHS